MVDSEAMSQLVASPRTNRLSRTSPSGFPNVDTEKDAIAVAAGREFSMALLSNGTVVTWGENQHGQLGNGTKTQTDLPVEVCAVGSTSCSSHLEGVVAIAAGNFFSMALLSSGKVVTWGSNQAGQLGNKSEEESSVPVEVSGLSGVAAISADTNAGVALLTTGAVKTWGSNREGQLGTGSTSGPEMCEEDSVSCSTVPVEVSGLTGVTAIAGSNEASFALSSTGSVKAWGYGGAGRLGDGKTESKDTPTSVCENASCSKPLGEVTAIAGGFELGLAALRDGEVVAWGENKYGQLGDGTSTGPETCGVETYCSKTPVEVDGLDEVAEIAAGPGNSSFAEESPETCFGKVMSALAPTTACPFPDKASTGASGSLTTVTPEHEILHVTHSETIANKRILGEVAIEANNVKLENDEVVAPNSEESIDVLGARTGISLDRVTCKLESSTDYTDYCLLISPGAKVTANDVFFESCAECIHGTLTLENSFVFADRSFEVLGGAIEHDEGIYYGGGGGPLVVKGDTILTNQNETAAVFVSRDFGSVTTYTLENSMVAGGDYSLYGGGSDANECSTTELAEKEAKVGKAAAEAECKSQYKESGEGKLVGPVTVKNNDFPRCVDAERSESYGLQCDDVSEEPEWPTKGTLVGEETKTFGFYPRAGDFGPDQYFSVATSGLYSGGEEPKTFVWEDNHYDSGLNLPTGVTYEIAKP